LRGVIHCFTGTPEQARQYLDLGLCVGFTGIIFKPIPGIDWSEIIKVAPLEKILVETDAPYLAPPQAGQERSEPLFVKYVVEEIARIKNLGYQEVSEVTTKNARELFKI
jgi:TatD DNase family protein